MNEISTQIDVCLRAVIYTLIDLHQIRGVVTLHQTIL